MYVHAFMERSRPQLQLQDEPTGGGSPSQGTPAVAVPATGGGFWETGEQLRGGYWPASQRATGEAAARMGQAPWSPFDSLGSQPRSARPQPQFADRRTYGDVRIAKAHSHSTNAPPRNRRTDSSWSHNSGDYWSWQADAWITPA